MTSQDRPNMHPVDTIIVVVVTLVIAVGLYSGCTASQFEVDPFADGPAADTGAATSETAPDTGAPDGAETSVPDAPALEAKGETSTPPADAPTPPTDAPTDAPTDTATCVHSNGLGQSYTYCVPLGTPGDAAAYSMEMAKRARAAWPVAGTDGEGACEVPGAPSYVWRKTATTCAAWTFTNGTGSYASSAGHAYLGDAACSCPSSTCAAWD